MNNLDRIIKKVIRETQDELSSRYMFFSNLEQMKEAYLQTINDFEIELINTEWWRFKRISWLQNQIEYYEGLLNTLLTGHDWAQDHISEAKNNMDQVFDFIMNESKKDGMGSSMGDEDIVMMEGRKKKNVATNQKLWKECLSWAKQRYDVCPSAYCNGAAVKRYNSKGGNWKKG